MRAMWLIVAGFLASGLGACVGTDNERPATPALPDGAKVQARAPDWTQFVKRPAELQWGPEVNGLRMACWLDTNARVYGVIRNVSGKAVTYNEYYLGATFSVRVRARLAGKGAWRDLPRVEMARTLLSAGPSPSYRRTLAPGADMPLARRSVADPKLPPPLFTFTGSLDVQWPEEWVDKPVEIIIAQKLTDNDPGEVWQGTVESAPIRLYLRKVFFPWPLEGSATQP